MRCFIVVYSYTNCQAPDKYFMSEQSQQELQGLKGRPTAEREVEITDAIIRAATELFLERGYESTAIEAVARETGVYKNAIYRRFANKEALFQAVVDARVSEWTVQADQLEEDHGKTLEQKLKSHLLRAVRWASHPEVQAFLNLRSSLSAVVTNTVRQIAYAAHQSMIAKISHDLREYSSGDDRVAADPEKVALAMLSMLQGWMEIKSLEGSAITQQQAAEYVDWIVELVTTGRQAW